MGGGGGAGGRNGCVRLSSAYVVKFQNKNALDNAGEIGV